MKISDIVAYTGYTIVVLSSIVLLIFLIEFDIEGNLAKHSENYIEGTFAIEEEQPTLVDSFGKHHTLLRTTPEDFQQGSLVLAYTLPETTYAIPEYQIPHIPRGLHDIAIVGVVLFVGMLLVACNPKIAYFDFLKHV